MTPQELKNSILQLAIQGKLVEQRPEEGTGEELLREISAAKNAKNAKGNLSRRGGGAENLSGGSRSRATVVGEGRADLKHLPKAALSLHGTLSAPSASPREEISPEEQPFDIPESWVWVRLGEILRVIGGVSYDKKDVAANGYRILRGGNIQNMKVILAEDDVFLPEQYKDEEKLVRVGDILIVASTGSKTVIGKAGYVDRHVPNTMIGAFLRICRPCSHELVDYLRLIFESDFYRKHIRVLAQGTNINNVKESYITHFAIPLPPLAEQKRIVAKIEELLPYVERYEKAWSRLEEFNRRFPEDMRKSLLQMAIQGRLVEQRPEEGTAAELLEKIFAAKNAKDAKKNLTQRRRARGEKATAALFAPPREEIPDPPFDIPESWEWVRLGEVADVQLGKMLDKGRNKGIPHPYLANLSVRWRSFDLSALRMMPFTEIECEKFALLPGDVLMCEGGVPGRCAVWREKNSHVKYQKAIHRIRCNTLLPDFIQRYFEAICDSSWFAEKFTGTTIKHLPRETLCNTPFPLPPLAEQKRIVAKLEELLPLCERLKAKSGELSQPELSKRSEV